MEWIKTVLNAVRVAVDGVSARVDRLKSRVKSVEDWVKSLDWVPKTVPGTSTIMAEKTFPKPTSSPLFTPLKIPAVGNIYYVVWNGEKYRCTAFTDDSLSEGTVGIGKLMNDEVPSEGYLFEFIFWEAGGSLHGALSTEQENVTVSIYEKIKNTNYLPDTFLPKSLDLKFDKKVDKQDPVFSGAFSQNRKQGSRVGDKSHAEGWECTASGGYSHAEGDSTRATGSGGAHAEGESTQSTSRGTHAEGGSTVASAYYAHAEGQQTTASGQDSHAEGFLSVASGSFAHAEGQSEASGQHSHAEGHNTKALGRASHAEGYITKATGDYQHVQGKMNIEDTAGKYSHIVGNGKDGGKRSNAHTLDWHGVPWFQGRPQFGGTAQDDGSQSVVANGDKEFILASSTEGSTKKFKVTVDDSGTLKATEITN